MFSWIWAINQCSASCMSIPVRILKILSCFTLELWMNLLTHARAVNKRRYLLNLVESMTGSLGCTTQLTLGLLFLSISTMSFTDLDLKSFGQSISNSWSHEEPLHHNWFSTNWLTQSLRIPYEEYYYVNLDSVCMEAYYNSGIYDQVANMQTTKTDL